MIKEYLEEFAEIADEWFEKEYPPKRYEHIPLVSFMKDIISQQAQHLTLDNFIEE